MATVSAGVTAARHANVGYAPQDEALYPTLSTEANLRYFGRLAGLRGAELSDRVSEVAQHLLLSDLLGQRAGTMSGGQRRRLHTALALMHRPTVLLLDEPTVGVDIGARAELLEFVRATAARGAAILYSTHQFAEIDALSARVVIIDRGRVLASGSAADVAARYAPAGFELVFDATGAPPPSLADGVDAESVDEAGWTPAGSYRVVLRRSDDRSVGDVVEALPAAEHQRLLSATVLEPSIERAYLRLVSARSDTAGRSRPGSGPGGRSMSSVPTVARHELTLIRSEIMPFAVYFVMPIVIIAFVSGTFDVYLQFVDPVPGATGADLAAPGQATMFGFMTLAGFGYFFLGEFGWGTWNRMRCPGHPVVADPRREAHRRVRPPARPVHVRDGGVLGVLRAERRRPARQPSRSPRSWSRWW